MGGVPRWNNFVLLAVLGALLPPGVLNIPAENFASVTICSRKRVLISPMSTVKTAISEILSIRSNQRRKQGSRRENA